MALSPVDDLEAPACPSLRPAVTRGSRSTHRHVCVVRSLLVGAPARQRESGRRRNKPQSPARRPRSGSPPHEARSTFSQRRGVELRAQHEERSRALAAPVARVDVRGLGRRRRRVVVRVRRRRRGARCATLRRRGRRPRSASRRAVSGEEPATAKMSRGPANANTSASRAAPCSTTPRPAACRRTGRTPRPAAEPARPPGRRQGNPVAS